MPTFATRPLTASSTIPVEFPQNYMVGQQRLANIGIAVQQIPSSTIIFGLEDTIQKSSDYLFSFSIGCNLMDHRSGDG